MALENPDHADAYLAPGRLVFQPRGVITEGLFTSVQANTDPATGLDIVGDAANEPSLAVRLNRPHEIVIGWRQFDNIASNYRKAGYAYSHDRGLSWSGKHVLDDNRQGSDPVLRAGPIGQIYYLSYHYTTSGNTELYETFDAGVIWNHLSVSTGEDKAWLAVDMHNPSTLGYMYQNSSSVSRLVRSFDGGFNWSHRNGGVPRWGHIDILSSGEVYLVGGNSQTSVYHYENAQDPAATPVSTQIALTGFDGPSYGDGTVNPGGLRGQANLAVDRSVDPELLCVGTSARHSADICDAMYALVHPVDGVLAGPVRINDDTDPDAWQWFLTLSCAPNGRLDAVWNDTRDDPDNPNPLTSRLYASYSTDGGLTWAPNFPVSPAYEHGLGYPNQSKLGDYYDMHSDDIGADVAYAATFLGGQDVYYLRLGTVDCDGNGVGDEMEIASGLGDVNGDGVLDACACLADLNGDGLADAGDLGAFITAYLGGDLSVDFTGDGVLDAGDIGLFVDAYLAGC